MTMRGSSPRARQPVTIDVRSFGWERAVVATLRHSTLAFGAIDAVPLKELRDIGTRDRLSLTGQFAAHLALLQFAGVADGEFDAAEWAVTQKRGADCRLVRVSGRRSSSDVPTLTIVQQFSSFVRTPALDVLRRSSARAEAVYCEVDARLRSDAAADLRWFRAAAVGQVASPGRDVMRSILTASSGRFRFDDPECVASLRAASDEVVLIGDAASPLARYSGIDALRPVVADLDAMNPNEIVESVIKLDRRLVFVVVAHELLDPASRKVIELLQASDAGVWIDSEGDGIELPETAWFIVSPRVTARQELAARVRDIPRELRPAKFRQFVDSPCFARYLTDGTVPSPQMAAPTAAIREPSRSFLAAVALLGTSCSIDLARRFLANFSPSANLRELVFDGVSAIEGDQFRFTSEDMRNAVLEHIPATSRGPLSKNAAEMLAREGHPIDAALLFLESGDASRCVALLESVAFASHDEALRVLGTIRADVLSPALARRLVEALIACGRYRDARELTRFVPEPDAFLAQIERRTGDYASALTRATSDLLRAELLALLGRTGEAEAVYRDFRPQSNDERLLHGYQRAVLALDRGASPDRSWLDIESPLRAHCAARFATADALAQHDVERALAASQEAIATARTMAERIDATLDHVFALFTAGRWPEARANALDALLIVDETQGDRAAGGILFLLALLAADDGQWAHATHLVERLRQFYSDVHDENRLLELDLIAATIELSRGRFDSALAAADSVLASRVSAQIREAAALIRDEVVLLTDRSDAPAARGDTANVELTDRFLLLRRSGDILRPFVRHVCDWERNGAPVPVPETGSDRLMLMRAAIRKNDRALATRIATEMSVTLDDSIHATDAASRFLRIAATREFPFAQHDFAPARWRFATRNRLGQWSEIGSMAPLAASELDQASGEDWIACGDHELLFIQGLKGWPAESREAVAAMFRTRAENYRLRRIVEQEESSPAREPQPVEGIVGQSPAIHDICDLIGRIAKRDVPVCILGESGTGKELIARAIHRQSSRRHKPFTTINCAALPENLIESELFGTARGAFTGADRDRAGLIETTDGGTLFLDEVGEMPLAAQAKLLRFLQEGEFRRVGETPMRSADVRVVTATNRKLETAVESGRFREDLYYRIRGVEVILPPLRDRASDIPLLASHFLAREREKHRGGPHRLSPDAEAVFASYHWPGNIRELQNAIRAAHAIAADAKEIDLEHLPDSLQRVKVARKTAGSYQDAVVRFRRDLIEKSLAQANGNQNQAAQMLKISRQALAYQIRELGILVTPPKRPRV